MAKLKYFFKGFVNGQKSFGENIARVVNSILLTIVYFVGFGLTSIFGKIFKKDFLELSINKEKETYWKELNLKDRPREVYYRQF